MNDELVWTSACGIELDWRRFGFAVELSFGAWVPAEWGVYIRVGPILIGLGMERAPKWYYAPLSSSRPEPTEGTQEGTRG